MEDGARPVAVGHRLLEANVEEHRPVEQVAVRLVHHVDPIMQLLPPFKCKSASQVNGLILEVPEDGVEVVEKYGKLWQSPSVWNHNCHLAIFKD